MDLLARREHGCVELHRKLCNKGFDADQVDQVIAECVASGYLSDQRYLEAFVHSKATRGFGALKIRVELQAKGFLSADIQAYFQSLPDDYWQQAIAVAAAKKFGVITTHAERAKCIRYLQYKGFTMAEISDHLKRQTRDDEQRTEA